MAKIKLKNIERSEEIVEDLEIIKNKNLEMQKQMRSLEWQVSLLTITVILLVLGILP